MTVSNQGSAATPGMPPSGPGIHLRNAAFAIGGKPILKGITADLTERRIGIVGRNGSGKSTLLRMMAGLIAPTTGEVRVDGIDPARDRKAMVGTIGILFQNPDHQILFPTVEEELGFGLLQMGRGRQEVRDAVASLLAAEDRSHWARASTHTLSQGQRHYLNLLSILLMRPRIILLDEPFAGLDLPMQIRLTRRLAALPQQLITISHDPDTVSGCDRVLWLEDGRICRDGPAGEVTPEFVSRMVDIGEQDADTHLAD